MLDFPSRPLVQTWLSSREMENKKKFPSADSFCHAAAWLREFLNGFSSGSEYDEILLERLEQLIEVETTLVKILHLMPPEYQPIRVHVDDDVITDFNPLAKGSKRGQSKNLATNTSTVTDQGYTKARSRRDRTESILCPRSQVLKRNCKVSKKTQICKKSQNFEES